MKHKIIKLNWESSLCSFVFDRGEQESRFGYTEEQIDWAVFRLIDVVHVDKSKLARKIYNNDHKKTQQLD